MAVKHEVRAEILRRNGISLSEWARKHGFQPHTVRAVLSGQMGFSGNGEVTNRILLAIEEDTGISVRVTSMGSVIGKAERETEQA